MLKHLRLEEMDQRHQALTAPIAGSYQEAAAVCLNRHHTSPIVITLSDNENESSVEVNWTLPDSRTLGAWANTTDATEFGAYCCVIAGVEELRGLYAVRRAETGTGADYYVGPPGAGTNDLENCLRLEVSGVDGGDHREVAKRVLQKVQQAREGRSSLPAIAGVIGFSAKLIMLRDAPEAP